MTDLLKGTPVGDEGVRLGPRDVAVLEKPYPDRREG